MRSVRPVWFRWDCDIIWKRSRIDGISQKIFISTESMPRNRTFNKGSLPMSNNEINLTSLLYL